MIESLEKVYSLKVRNCIYVLEHDSKKKIQVFGCRDMLNHLDNLLKKIDGPEYNYMIGDLKNLNIKVLEKDILETDIRDRLNYWIDLYKKEGYKFYKPEKVVEYTIKTKLELIGTESRFCVYAYYKRNRKLIAVFKSKQECEDFLTMYYREFTVYTSLVFGDKAEIDHWNGFKRIFSSGIGKII